MKILLIWPNGFETKTVLPLSLAYLKSNVSSNNQEVELLDCAINNISADSKEFQDRIIKIKPDVIGVSCWSILFGEALKIFSTAKKIFPEATTIIGGVHATAYASKCITENDIDFVMTGEAEHALTLFLDQLERTNPDFSNVPGLVYHNDQGLIIQNYPDRIEDLDRLVIPDYSAIELERYISSGYRYLASSKRNAPIWVTRGCPYTCKFCTAPIQNGKKIRKHSAAYLIEWIKYLYVERKIRFINIIDDNFTFDVDYAVEVCQAIIDLDMKDLSFGTPNGIRVQRSTPELFQVMKKAGWKTVMIAPESGSPATLKRMQKALSPEIIPGKVKEIKEAGLKVFGFFILGYPGDTVDDLLLSKKLIEKCKFDFVNIVNFQPLPGTPIYDDLVSSGEIREGQLPVDNAEGGRVYTPPELKNFNFSRFILSCWIKLVLHNPRAVFSIIYGVNPFFMIKRLLNHLQEASKVKKTIGI